LDEESGHSVVSSRDVLLIEFVNSVVLEHKNFRTRRFRREVSEGEFKGSPE
jgi:hypothetical protein